MSETNSKDLEQLYRQRLGRYVTAMRNGKPDCVPIRPFVAEFTASYAGYTCQEVTHDYQQGVLAAARSAPPISTGTPWWATWSTCGPA